MTTGFLTELTAYIKSIPQIVAAKDSVDRQNSVGRLVEHLNALVNQVTYHKDKWNSQKDGRLAHYTSWENVLAILIADLPVLRMYNYEVANDPLEGHIVPPEWTKVWTKHERFLRTLNLDISTDTYGCSFSSGRDIDDDLTSWRLYGNNGEGCSLAMSKTVDGMFKVRYRRPDGKGRTADEESEDKRVADEMDSLLETGEEVTANSQCAEVVRAVTTAIQKILGGYRHSVKDIAYQEEREWRRIRVNPSKEDVEFHVDGGNVRRFVKGPKIGELLDSLSAITIGPKVYNRQAARAYVEWLARKKGIRYTCVRVSEKSYR